MIRHAIGAVSAFFAACALCAPVHGADVAAPTLRPPGEVQIVDRDSGELLTVYWHNGQRWIAGLPGHRYAVRLQSRANGRVLAVVSVDGINAISGQTAGWNQSGYVLYPWQSTDVLGWRKSQERVADFVFGTLEDSYAARTGRPDNAGVIGVAFFREAPRDALAPSAQIDPGRDDSSANGQAPAVPGGAGAAQAAPRARAERPPMQGSLGTGHGASEESLVESTSFERAQSIPDLVISIRYDRRERLVAMGIIRDTRPPLPFPESAQFGFVADPPLR
ncbi:MAG TPA: hypothetical protein VED47_08070 [Burkholderiaceae bacterium]|nr:hypothetical protein [Burkholderiaceae bacterium]